MSDLKELAKKFRDGGNTYQDYRMFLFKPEELKEYADLLDPPTRFNEVQMAFWRVWHNFGADRCRITVGCSVYALSFTSKDGAYIGTCDIPIKFMPLEVSNPLDLAELLGKDAT